MWKRHTVALELYYCTAEVEIKTHHSKNLTPNSRHTLKKKMHHTTTNESPSSRSDNTSIFFTALPKNCEKKKKKNTTSDSCTPDTINTVQRYPAYKPIFFFLLELDAACGEIHYKDTPAQSAPCMKGGNIFRKSQGLARRRATDLRR